VRCAEAVWQAAAEPESWSKVTLAAKHRPAAGDHLPSNMVSMFPSSQWESPSGTTGKSSLLLGLPAWDGAHPTHASGLLPSVQIPLLPCSAFLHVEV